VVHFRLSVRRDAGPVTLDDVTGRVGLRGRIPRTLVRFCTVGVANTVIDVVLFWALVAPLGILAANFVSTSAGMTFSFVLNGRHTFGASRLTMRQGFLFVATNGFTMWLLQPLLIATAHDVFATPLMFAKVISLGGSVVANFLLYRFVVWPRSSTTRTSRAGDPLAVPEAAGV
jgi:putative flippase GtrA